MAEITVESELLFSVPYTMQNECSFVSLRDVERCLVVLKWFSDHMYLLRPLLDERAKKEHEEEEKDVGQVRFNVRINVNQFIKDW